jgi:hypothetical protein
VLSGLGLWSAYLAHQQESAKARPALDITGARVIDRSALTFDDGKPDEIDEIELTVINRGTVEAADVTFHNKLEQSVAKMFSTIGKPVPTLRADNIPPNGTWVREVPDNPISGDGMPLTTVFREWITYTDRFNGKKYSEAWCFDTSEFRPTVRFVDPGLRPEKFKQIELQVCPTTR